MRYVEHAPPAALAHIVECFWFLDADPSAGEPMVERIIPDGCAEIIIQCGDRFRRVELDGAAGAVQPRTFLAGVMSRFWLVQPLGVVSTMGIRLRPGGVGSLFPGPASEVAEQATPLDSLWGRAAIEFEDRILEASADSDRMRIASSMLQSVTQRPLRVDGDVEAAVGRILRSRGRTPMLEVARSASSTPRTLQRRFHHAVGVSPKSLARIVRFQHLMQMLGARRAERWTDLALAAGFYDQAHLVRDFRQFTGQSPTRFIADDGALSRCFAAPDRLARLLDG